MCNSKFSLSQYKSTPDIMSGIPRKKTLDELKSETFAELKRRGYDVSGKTPAQIRKSLKY